MSALAVTVALDGKQVSVEELGWFLTMPCGCLVGATIIDRHDGYVLTEDSAWKQFYEFSTAARLKQAQRRGLTVFLGHRSRAREMTMDCPHEPKWGGMEPTTPDGYEWRVREIQGNGAQHYLPKNVREVGNDLDDVAALCGAIAKRWDWHPSRAAWKNRHDCTRCLKAAGGAR